MKQETFRSPASDNTHAGIALMAAAFCIFAFTGAVAKLVLSTYPVGEMIFFRSVIAMIVLFPFVVREGVVALRAMPRPKLQLVRVIVSVIEVTMFFLSISYLPLADTLTVFMSGTLFVTLWSILFLGERIEWQRGVAIIAGFVGVLIAMRPSAATVSLLALIPLAGTMLYAVNVLTTRALRGTSGTVLAFNQMVGAALLGVASILIPGGWLIPALKDFGLFVLIGVPSAIGYFFISRAITLAPANVVAPYQYTLVIWGTVFGYLFFGDIPLPTTVIGAVIIAGAGLYLSRCERAVRP